MLNRFKPPQFGRTGFDTTKTPMLKNFDMPDGDTCLNLDQDQENLIAARARYVLALEGLSPLDRLDAQLRGQLEHAIDRIDEKLAAMGVQLSAKAP